MRKTKARTKAELRERKKTKKMKVSGRRVKELGRLIGKKSESTR